MIFTKESSALWERCSNTNKIIQIYGKGGSGKSTLAMHFVKFILESGGKIVWIDTEKKTSPTRLQSIVGEKTRSILITRPKIYSEQEKMIQTVTSIDIPLSAIVIDTISQHFRFREKSDSWASYSEELQFFYENHILPLLTFQEKQGCYLVFVHQITYVPGIGDKPFMYKVFESISSEWICL